MRLGQAHTGTVLDLVVDLFEMLGRAAADFQHVIKLTGQIVAGNDIRMTGYDFDEIVIKPGMLHAHLHQYGDIVSSLLIVGDDRVGLDQSAFFKLPDPLDDGGYGQMNGFADFGRCLSIPLPR